MTLLEETIMRIISQSTPAVVPLLGVTVNVNIADHLADVELIHEWVNPCGKAITAEYVTPIAGGNRAVYKFVAQFADQTVVAQVMESKKADDTYDKAIALGDTAFRGEQLSDDALKFSLGNIPAGEHITTTLYYTQRLDVVSGNIRWSLPTCVGPRYCAEPDRQEMADPSMGSRAVADYKLIVNGYVRSHWPLVLITSGDPVVVANGKDYTGCMDANFVLTNVRLDHPVVVDIESLGVGEPACWAQYDPQRDQTALLLSMTPVPASTSEQAHEIIFMLDRSGSMMGQRIATARKALVEAIGLLPPQTLINVVSFGSRWELLYPQSCVVTSIERENLVQCVGRMNADFGGTEIGNAVRGVLATPRPETSVTRQVVLITDGEVGSGDGDKLVALIRDQPEVRFFTIGIGSSVSENTCRQLAKTSGGAFELITPKNGNSSFRDLGISAPESLDGIIECVKRQLARILTPVLECAVIDWGETCTQIPYQLRPMYVDEPMFVYSIRDGRVADEQIGVAFVDPSGFEITKLAPIESLPDGQDIWRLAVNEQIEDLQYGPHGYVITQNPEIKNTIIAISVQYGILSPHTKFVGVRQNTKAQIADTMVSVPQYAPADRSLSFAKSSASAICVNSAQCCFSESFERCAAYNDVNECEEEDGDTDFGMFDDEPCYDESPHVEVPGACLWLDSLLSKLKAFADIRQLLDQDVQPQWPSALRHLVEYAQTGLIMNDGIASLATSGILASSSAESVRMICLQLLKTNVVVA